MHPSAAERRRPLTAGEIARLVRALGRDVVGLDATPLLGGLDTATYRLDVRVTDGTSQCLVLHQYRGWEPARASDRVNREHRLLEAIGPVFRWAPRTLLSDPSGELLGDPATLLTYLPGAPAPPPQVPSGPARERWIDEFARPLVALHGIPLDRLPSDCRTDDPDGGLEGSRVRLVTTSSRELSSRLCVEPDRQESRRGRCCITTTGTATRSGPMAVSLV